jgi:hypothetical protein
LSAKGCLTLAIVALIVVWTALMGALIGAGMVGVEVLERVARAVFGDTPQAREAVEAMTGFVRHTAGSFLGLIWGIGTAALIALWLIAWRSARDGEGGGSIVIRVDDRDGGIREMKDVTPRRDELLPPSRGDDGRRR